LNGSDTAPPGGRFYREHRPVVPHPLVECWWEQRAGAGGHVQRVLPDACADVIVSSGGGAVVVGPAISVQLPRLAGGEHLWGLRLRAAGIGAALGLPAQELRDLQVPLRELFPALDAARITDQVRRGDLPTVLDPGARDRRVERALAALRRPLSRVARVAGELDVSERHLRRLVLAHTGLEPRMVQRVARFQRFLLLSDRPVLWDGPVVPDQPVPPDGLRLSDPSVLPDVSVAGDRPDLSDRAGRGGSGWSLAALAARAGYADQAHLSREVRALSGLTPSTLLAERRHTT
jgi:AraC-like DNA-binding protein